MHFTTYKALLLAAVPVMLGAACIGDDPHVIDRKTKDAQTQTPASDAAAKEERLRPPESTEVATSEPISLAPAEQDAQVAEQQAESPLRPTSLFTDAAAPPDRVVDDDAGGYAPTSASVDAAITSAVRDASVSTDIADQRVDSGPPRIPAPTQPGELVITEAMANPKTVPDSQGEWFELYNPSQTATYNLRGCEIADDGAVKCTIGTDLIVAPLGWITIARNASPGFTPTHVCSGLSLTNSDPDQVIVRCGAKAIDRMAYEKAKEATSLALDPAKLDAKANDDPTAWCAATAVYNDEDLGTPGAPNAACAN